MSRIASLTAAIREAGDMAPYVSPMKAAKDAFRKATNNGDWSRYRRMMDSLLNKWGFHHFHVEGGRTLVFAYLCRETRTAHVLDVLPHDRNWGIERHLVGIAVREWPEARIARPVGRGRSSMDEEILRRERQAGVNAQVEVDGTFFLPHSRALMMDGSGFDAADSFSPVAYTGRRIGTAEAGDEMPRSPHMMMVGVDPDDPRPSWLVATEQAAVMSRERRRARAKAALDAGVGPVAEAVRETIRMRPR